MRRRLVFATPFVIVASCKRPIESPREVPDEVAPTTRAPTDAAVVAAIADAPVDARDVPIDAFDAAEARRLRRAELEECRSGRAICNPPAPVARVVEVMVEGSEMRVTLDAGAARGVTTRWTAEFVDRDQKPLPGGTCVIVRVDKERTRCKVKLTQDQIMANPRVRFRVP
jgi:hypothetical protein